MTVPREARRYGTFITTYSGHGHFVYADGHESDDAAFWSGQRPDGRIVLACRGIVLSLRIDPSTLSFVGTTDTGLSFNSYGGLDVTRSMQHGEDKETLLLCTQVDIGTCPPLQERLHIWYGLTNFRFWGAEEYALTKSSHVPAMSFNLQRSDGTMYRARLVRRADYDKQESILRAVHGIAPTAELQISLEPSDQPSDIDSLATDMCQILSIAQGTRIQWIYRRITNENRRVLSIQHIRHFTSNYSPSQIIKSQPGDTTTMKRFIETAFPAFISKRGPYELDKGIIDTYLGAKSEYDITASNGLKLAIVMEMLAHANLRANGLEECEKIVPQNDFENCLDGLETTIEGYLTSRNLKPKTAKWISHRARELNNSPFKDILDQLFKSIGLDVVKSNKNTIGDAQLFADCRNSLAHKGQFLSTTRPPGKRCPIAQGWPGNKQEYFFMVSLVDRVFLRLLNYDGPYQDWRVAWDDLAVNSPPISRAHVNDLGVPS